MELQEQVTELAEDLKKTQKLFVALGDEVRQHMIIEMIKLNKYEGIRVGEIAEKAKLSRSAVSHHLQILKETGIVSVRRDGTRNYYYFDARERCEMVIQLLKKVQQIEDMVSKPNLEREW